MREVEGKGKRRAKVQSYEEEERENEMREDNSKEFKEGGKKTINKEREKKKIGVTHHNHSTLPPSVYHSPQPSSSITLTNHKHLLLSSFTIIYHIPKLLSPSTLKIMTLPSSNHVPHHSILSSNPQSLSFPPLLLHPPPLSPSFTCLAPFPPHLPGTLLHLPGTLPSSPGLMMPNYGNGSGIKGGLTVN
ncbi:hypothetical protein Pcinc_044246 [Petrolisthes cinctipes]|uniref:Uncharacterized protein n=1 Tax=Petrolisthes cinctipes TaxID=88211 RepID=A0AAE1EFG3_PETCI|nr:hypothetical protein Pcinc_044246 [Petrolisthes cinctipes]